MAQCHIPPFDRIHQHIGLSQVLTFPFLSSRECVQVSCERAGIKTTKIHWNLHALSQLLVSQNSKELLSHCIKSAEGKLTFSYCKESSDVMTTCDYDLDANFFAYYSPLTHTLSICLPIVLLTVPFLALPLYSYLSLALTA